tara:strand:- start:1355 stop:2332 length:978 start_codon:yes stop_codon:yes gene_type:complete
MSEENEDGWSTINTSPDNKKEAPPVIEFEDSKGDPVAAPESTQVELEIVQEEQSTDEKESQKPEELQGINTKGAEKRIRKLVAQRKERDEQLTLALDKIRSLENALSDKDKNITDYQRQSVDSKKEEIQRRVETAKASFSRAFDDGDKDILVKSQSDLSEAQAELKMLEYAALMNQSRGTTQTDVSQPQATPQRAQPQKFDEGAVEWAEKNDWFGKDKIGTTIALAMDQSLKEEGFDPRDDDFYEELDKRLSTELPSRLRPGGGDVKTNTQVVAGQSRRQATSNKVRLTQADVSLAKKWGLTLERYAAEKKKAERSAGDYTLING